MTSLLNTALLLAEAGIRVFPLKPMDKMPIVTNGVKEATTDENIIRAWWLKWPKANIGIAMGEASGILGLDIDYHGDKTGKNKARTDFLQSIPSTITTITPGGGHHAFFKYDSKIKNGLKLEEGVTVRSDGFYFVAPPSIHPITKTTYAFLQNGNHKYSLWDGEVAELPDWIYEINKKETEEKKTYIPPDEVVMGERNNNFFAFASSLRSKGMKEEEILAGLISLNERTSPGVKEIELKKLAKRVCDTYPSGVNAGGVKEKKKEPSPHFLSRKFLIDCGFYDDKNRCLLKYYQQDFYRYRNGYYQKLDDEWIEDRLNRWLVDIGLENFAGITKKTNPILKMLKTKPVYIQSQINTPCILRDGEWYSANHLIPMKNGLFDINHFIKTGESMLLPHTPDYFCRYKLGFDFLIDAKCPTYDQICNDIFSSQEEIDCWNEVMGIHLYSPFLIENFFILEGEGANGKSVLRTILTCLLGKENVSSVPIECFNPSSFAFINTLGKLANIIPDMKDVSDIDEGALKAFVSKEEMSFNRKGKPFIDSKPTAYLTICTNVLPRFNDKSDGIWRRIILFKLEKTIPVEKQNPLFRESYFWESGNELSGIFNKILMSLMAVCKNGKITVPINNKINLEKYKQDLNIVYHFAEAHLEYSENGKASVKDVYDSYKKFCYEYGGKPFGKISFDKQLKNVFKKQGKEIEIEKQRPIQSMGINVGPVWQWVNLNFFGVSVD